MRVIDNEYDRRTLNKDGLIGRTKLLRITPEMAKRWLAACAENDADREERKKRVKKFCDIIRKGKWAPPSPSKKTRKAG